MSDGVGSTSIAVRVETWVRRRREAVEEEQVTEGLFTFVALDASGRPRSVRAGPEDVSADHGCGGERATSPGATR